AGTFGDQFGGGVESLRAALAVEAGDAFEIALGGFAGEFLGERGDVFFRKECTFLRDGGGRSQQEQRGDAKNVSHDSSVAREYSARHSSAGCRKKDFVPEGAERERRE